MVFYIYTFRHFIVSEMTSELLNINKLSEFLKQKITNFIISQLFFRTNYIFEI